MKVGCNVDQSIYNQNLWRKEVLRKIQALKFKSLMQIICKFVSMGK
jgi:hypothetical protein